MKCRISNKNLNVIHSFGKMPVANNFLKKNEFNNEYFYNLQYGFNEDLSLFQIDDYPPIDVMFHNNYAFYSGTSNFMKKHFQNLTENLLKKKIFNKNSFVIEIGCNDGILLENFKIMGIKHLGIEPSKNVAEVASKKEINILNSFFDLNSAKKVLSQYGYSDLILAGNVICHIPDLKNLIKSIDTILSREGIFIFEEPYLGDMINKTSYDQIYDEHVYIFSCMAIKKIFSMFDFDLFHAEHLETHGGSMRYYICRKGVRKITDEVKKLIAIEDRENLGNIETFILFAKNCELSKKNTLNTLNKIKDERKKVVGYGATSKSTTILNYCNIDSELIDYIVDTTPIKHWKYSPGMHIPIKPYTKFANDYPDYYFLFAWNHYNEISNKEKKFINSGGQFISHVKID